MDTFWYLLLGGFFAGYFVLAGYDYGVGLLLPSAGTPDERRLALNAVGPFFLGNEVWLVAAVGVLFGAFPRLEGELLSGLYPAVVVALLGVITVTAAVQLRSRPTGTGVRAGWDALIVAASAVAAGGLGAVLGGLLQGVPIDAAGQVAGGGRVATPFVAVSALAMVVLVAVHGASFLALRLAPQPAARFARLGRGLVVPALVALGAAIVVGLLSPGVRAAALNPVPTLLLVAALAGSLAVAWTALGRRPGLAFAATAVALALPVVIVGAATYPYALASTVDGAGLTVADAAADGATLRLLSWLALPLVPALVGFQAMLWWAFRGRLDRSAPLFW